MNRYLRAAASLAVLLGGIAGLSACGGDDTSTPSPAVAGITVEPSIAALLPDHITRAKEIKVAVDLPYPPYEYLDADGGLTGFEYDLGQAVGAVLGVKVTFVKQSFDGILPGLQSGKFDAAWSSITDNREREQALDFVDYAQSRAAILVRTGEDVEGAGDLCGRTVSTLTGSTGPRQLAQQSKACVAQGDQPIEVKEYPSDSAAQLAVKSGAADATVFDAEALKYLAAHDGGGHTYDVVVYDDLPNEPQPLGVALVKGNDALRDALAAALQSLLDDGTYTKILDRYDAGDAALTTITVNGAVQ